MGLVIGLRLYSYRWPKRADGRSRRIWRGFYFASVLLMGLCWGMFYAVTILIYGYSHWTTLVLLICVAGVVAGATTSFAPNLAVMRGFLIALVGPSLAVTVALGDEHAFAMGLLLSAYLAFSWMQGTRQHREYWAALSDRQLLKIRAEELERATLAAEASNRAKSEFLANISHELRTPMNGVIGITDLTLDTELTAYQRENLRTVKSSAALLLTLLNDLLDFSKIEAGKIELETIPFSLRELLDVVTKPLAALARAKGLDFRWEAPPHTPDELIGDPQRLRQILVNLIANAVKFTERGEVRIVVEAVDKGAESADLQFTVIDTGIGVPLDKREVIFEPFTQADGAITRRYGGTGLGLTIAARLAKMVGGRIWFESEVEKGSAFHFQAPFELARIAESAREL